MLLVEPPMYGRDAAGQRIVASTHQLAETTRAAAATSRWTMRLRTPILEAAVFANIR